MKGHQQLTEQADRKTERHFILHEVRCNQMVTNCVVNFCIYLKSGQLFMHKNVIYVFP